MSVESPTSPPLILVPARLCARIGDKDVGDVEREANVIMTPYINALVLSGALPLIVPVPPRSLSKEARAEFIQPYCDLLRRGFAKGLMLAGGADLSPKLYGAEDEHCGEIYEEIDDLDLSLFKAAFDSDQPILGICRGLQVINVALGGSCWQTMSPKLLAVHDKHDLPRDSQGHNVIVKPGTRIAKIFGLGTLTTIRTNSLHHQCINAVGSGLVIAGVSEDPDPASNSETSTEDLSAPGVGVSQCSILEGGRVIELIEHESKWIFAAQCHPEELYTKSAEWRRAFDAFVAACSK